MDFLSQKQRQQLCSYYGTSTNEHNKDTKVEELNSQMQTLSVGDNYNNQMKTENNIENGFLTQPQPIKSIYYPPK